MHAWILAFGILTLAAQNPGPVLRPIWVPGKRPYPPLAYICRVEGVIPLDVAITQEGRPTRVEAKGGPALLRPCAEAFLAACVFMPIEKNGAKTALTLPYEFPFKLPQAAHPLPVIERTELRVSGVPAPEAPALEARIRGFLSRVGLPVGPEGKSDARCTLCLDLEVSAFRAGHDAMGHQLKLRCSRRTDRGLSGDAVPRDPRVWEGLCSWAQRGPEGPGAGVEKALDRLLAELVGAGKEALAPGSAPSGYATVMYGPPASGWRWTFTQTHEFENLTVRKESSALEYPTRALARRLDGLVEAEVTLDSQGTPVAARVVSGPSDFHSAALRYLMDWQFEPTERKIAGFTVKFEVSGEHM